MSMQDLQERVITVHYCDWACFRENVTDWNALKAKLSTITTEAELDRLINQYI